MPKNETKDWSKEDWLRESPRRYWDPSRRLLKSIRDYQITKSSFLRKIIILKFRFWSVVTGADIPLNCNISGGFLIPHPNGIVINPSSEIGANCLFFQQVTIAGKCKLGYHVDVGAGAKILGPVTIGNNVKIGANAVVNTDLPSDCTAVGIPARIVSKSK